MLFLLLFLDKTVVHINNLTEPPPMYKLREIWRVRKQDEGHHGSQLRYNKTVFPVVVAGSQLKAPKKAQT